MKVTHRGVKYLSYTVALLVGVVLAFFGVQSKNAGNSVAGGVLGETAQADHDYAQSTYYSEATYYAESSYYSQGYYQSYYQSAYGDDGDDGDDDGI